MIPFEKSEAETRERGAMLSPSCAQRKCIFFVAQRGLASCGRRSPFCRRLFATLGSFADSSSLAPCGGPFFTSVLRGHRFSSSLLCPFSHSAPILDATRPSPEASAIAKDMPRQAPSAMPKSKPRRRRRVTHVVARCEEPRRKGATAADGRRFGSASSFSTPTVRSV